MRKSLKAILLGAAVTALLCVSALAAEDYPAATTGGFHSVGTGLTIEVQTADGADITAAAATVDGAEVSDFYADGARMQVTYTGKLTEGDQYLVMLVTGDALPTRAESICYIDQKASASDEANGSIVFDVFPLLPTESTDMTLYITSNAEGFTNPIAVSLSFAVPPAPAYKLGDANLDGNIDVLDASRILDHVVERKKLTGDAFLAADVALPKGTVNVLDASKILDYIVGRISSFE